MACEVYGGCGFFLAHVRTLMRTQNFKQRCQQHCHDHSKWQYHPWLPNQNSWRLGCQSRFYQKWRWWKGSDSYSPYQARYQRPTCWAWPSIGSHYEIHHKEFWYSSHWYLQTMWRLCLGKVKQQAVSKKAVPCSQILGERLFFNISSPATPTFGSKCHWLLVIDYYSDYCWSFFLSEKSDLTKKMLVLIKDLKTKYNLQVQQLWCDNVGENQPSNKHVIRKGWGSISKTQPPVFPNKMGASNASFLPYFIKFTLYVMVETLLHTCVAVFGQKQLIQPRSSRITWPLPTGLLIHFNNFLGRESQMSSHQCKNLVKCELPLSRTTPIGLN